MNEYLKIAEDLIKKAEKTEDVTDRYDLYRRAELFIAIAQVKALDEIAYQING